MAKIGFQIPAEESPAEEPRAPLDARAAFERLLAGLAQDLAQDRAPRRSQGPRVNDSGLPSCVLSVFRLSPEDGTPQRADIATRGFPVFVPPTIPC